MAKTRSSQRRNWFRASLGAILEWMLILSALLPNSIIFAGAQPAPAVGTIKPTKYPLLFGSSGNIEIDIPEPGIAVRIEIPRDFLKIGEGTFPENDTSFVTSNIRNDHFYYNLVDESKHWTYDWHDNASDGACFKPDFSYYDPNAPYCLEIWNYLSSPLNYSTSPPIPYLKQPDQTIYCYTPGPTSYYDSAPPCPSNYFDHTLFPNHFFDYNYLVGVDYCQPPNLDRFVYQCFSTYPAPKVVLLHGLSSPSLAGVYNFTLSVANRTNILGYPDFVHAWSTTLYVPVSMAYNGGSIVGYVCDAGSGSPSCNNRIRGKGIVYALQCPSSGVCSLSNAAVVARAYVNQTLCQTPFTQCGSFDLTGLAPGINMYLVEGSAGVDRGVAYSLTPYANNPVSVSANQPTTGIVLALRRSPLVCVTINYENSNSVSISSLSGQTDLLAAGFRSNPNYNLNVTVEGTDPFGDVFRFQGVSTDSTSDSFTLTTGIGVKYVGTNPYGTEFAGLPAPEDYTGGYSITVNVWVSGYTQYSGFPSVQILHSPGTTTPSCSPSNQPSTTIIMRSGGIIIGTLRFQSSPQTLEPPRNATKDIPGYPRGQQALFGGNVVIEAYQNGILAGVTVINGTLPDGKTGYVSCNYNDTCATLPFYVVGFTEYYNHSLSGVWDERDYGLPDGTYSLSVYVRGYELTPTSIAISITNGGPGPVIVYMTRGGAFEVTTSSYDNILGNRTLPQACLTWRFVNSTIPVRARVYFDGSTGPIGYVEVLMATDANSILDGVISFSTCTFEVVFAGQNWGLQKIWFYNYLPTHITNDTYTIESDTLGYVAQFPGSPGATALNTLLGFSQNLVTLFYGNEVDETVPIFSTPQSAWTTPEYDHAVGQAFSGGLLGAEMANLTNGKSTLSFNIYGFGGMQLNATLRINSTYQVPLCLTDVNLSGLQNICGQGHFLYVDPTGTSYIDYGLDIGNYTAEVPEFGFTVHFLQAYAPPTIPFTGLLLRTGVVFSMIRMGSIYLQGSGGCVPGPGPTICGYTVYPGLLAPLSWAQVQATSSVYSAAVSTSDGYYYGVGALFLPGNVSLPQNNNPVTYTVIFSDVGYKPQTVTIPVTWGSSSSLTSPSLCPITPPTC